MKKSWIEKRDCGKNPQVKIIDKSFAGLNANSKMLVSSPKEIDDFIRNLPANAKISVKELRDELAKKHQADGTCPLSTGMFLRIVAEAALEEKQNGKPIQSITPFWKVISAESNEAKKLSIDSSQLKDLEKLGF